MALLRLCYSRWFGHFMFVAILLNLVVLAMDSPLNSASLEEKLNSEWRGMASAMLVCVLA